MAPKKRRGKKAHVSRSVRQTKPKDKLVELCPIQNKKCMFCGRTEISEYLYGKLYQLNDVVVHYYCILFSTNAPQKGLDNDGIFGFLLKDIKKALKKANGKSCFYCDKKGANICCSKINCRKTFHLPCGLENGSMNQYYDHFNSFCREHRIKQDVDQKYFKSSTLVECCICTEKVIPNDSLTSIWAPCCKKPDGWFHRKCIQELAFNAAYFFKCPLCNNVDNFKLTMLNFGIYIPSRDASWEVVPDAFAELLERHSTCNVDECVCPLPDERKSNADTGPWEIVLCNTCGSNGTHVGCSSLKCDQKWMCKLCSDITGNVGTKTRHNQIKNNISNIHQDESSTINNITSRQTNARRMSPRNMIRRSTRLNTNKKKIKNKSQSIIDSLVTSDDETRENESSTSCNMNPLQTNTRAMSRSNEIGESSSLNTKKKRTLQEPQRVIDSDDDESTIIDLITQFAIPDDETMKIKSSSPCNMSPRQTSARGMSRNKIGESTSLNTNKKKIKNKSQSIIDSLVTSDDETMENESSTSCNMNPLQTNIRAMSRSNEIGESTSLNTNKKRTLQEPQRVIDSDDDESTIIDSITQYSILYDETMKNKSSASCNMNPRQTETRRMSQSYGIGESTSLNTNQERTLQEPQIVIDLDDDENSDDESIIIDSITQFAIPDDETMKNKSSSPCHMNPRQTKARGMSRNKIGESTRLSTNKKRTLQEPQIVIDSDDDESTIIDSIMCIDVESSDYDIDVEVLD